MSEKENNVRLTIQLQYKGIPFEIQKELTNNPCYSSDLEDLYPLLDDIKKFIDFMLTKATETKRLRR